MTKLDYYIKQDPPDDANLRGTPKQRRIWKAVLENRNQMPTEVADEAGVDQSHVRYVLLRTTEDDLDEFEKNLEEGKGALPADFEAEKGGNGTGGDTHIYIFSDMSAEEIREFLKI